MTLVFYDYQCFMSPYGGNPLYISKLLNGLEYTPVIPYDFKTCNVYYHERTGTPIYQISQNKYLNYARYFGYGYLNKKKCIDIFKKQSFDVFHPTYYNPYFLDHIGKKPYVVMVPDMTHELFPYMFGNAGEVIHNKARVMENATKIIAITENTRRDIITLGGIDPAKIAVIPLATSLRVTNWSAPSPLPKKYILFVGNRGLYKNFGVFARVAASIIKRKHGISLVCAGGGEFGDDEKQLLSSLGILDKVHYRTISHDFANIYSNAEVFVFPSLYEGFGIPTLEAMSCGCPVCCSNTSAFPEVAGGAARYFDPYNASDMKSAIQDVIENPDLREGMISEGYIQSDKFSWDLTRKQTAEIYKEVA